VQWAERQHQPIQLHLLGGFCLERHGERLHVSATIQRILALLALCSRPTLRTFIAGTLWPDVSEPHATDRLRAALWRLPCYRDEFLHRTRTELSLCPDVSVDYWRAISEARQSICVQHQTTPGDRTGLELDLLPGWDEDWVLIERERLRQLRLHALESTCDALLEAHQPARTIELCLDIISGEPLRESTHRILVRAHLMEGNRQEALRTYEQFRGRLAAALGLEPSPLMSEIAAAIVASAENRLERSAPPAPSRDPLGVSRQIIPERVGDARQPW
jgi:DNA-binding SARP family transcriptional activator